MPPESILYSHPARSCCELTQEKHLGDAISPSRMLFQVFVFGPDRRIWELDAKATAGDAMGRTYMQRFYEGAVLHDRRRRDGRGTNKGVRTAWVNGREVDDSYLLKNGDIFDVQAASCGAPEQTPQDAAATSTNTTRVSDSWRVLSTPPSRRLPADHGS